MRREPVNEEAAFAYLIEGVSQVVSYAAKAQVSVSLEPEPGMLIETNGDYDRLCHSLPQHQCDQLHLALDVGHVWVTGEMNPADAVMQYAQQLGTVAIEGMDKGVHIHRPIHEGDMDIPPILANLQRIGFEKLVCVELSRESPRAHEAIPESIATLRELALRQAQ